MEGKHVRMNQDSSSKPTCFGMIARSSELVVSQLHLHRSQEHLPSRLEFSIQILSFTHRFQPEQYPIVL